MPSRIVPSLITRSKEGLAYALVISVIEAPTEASAAVFRKLRREIGEGMANDLEFEFLVAGVGCYLIELQRSQGISLPG